MSTCLLPPRRLAAGGWQLRNWLIPTVVWLGCGHSAAPDSAAKAQAGQGKACAASQQRPDGSCCAAGEFFDVDAHHCSAVGLPECGTAGSLASPNCSPRWCSHGDAGEIGSGDVCDPAADASATSCRAGEFADPSGGCHPAGGRIVLPSGEVWVADESTQVAALPPLPPPTLPLNDDGCEVGEVRDGDACVPEMGAPWVCPPGFSQTGFAPDGELTDCLPSENDCGLGTFGNVPDEPGYVYVDPQAFGGDGSKAKPMPSLPDAMAAFGPNKTYVLAAGSYLAMKLAASVHLIGRCAAKVTISAANSPNAALTATGGNTTLVVEGVTLRDGTGGGVIGHAGAKVMLDGVRITANSGYGILLDSGSVGSVTNCLIDHNTSPIGTPLGAGGIRVNGGSVGISQTRISANSVAGIRINSASAEVDITGVVIDQSLQVNKSWGPAIFVANSTVTVTGSRLSHNQGAGIYADSQAAVLADHVLVDGSLDSTDAAGLGTAAAAMAGSQLSISHLRSLGMRAGVEVRDSGTQAYVFQARFDSPGWHAAVADGGAALTLDRIFVGDFHRQAVVIQGAATKGIIDHVLVVGSTAAPDATHSMAALGVYTGSQAQVHDFRVTQTDGVAFLVHGAASQLTGTGLTADQIGENPGPHGGGCFGLAVIGPALVDVERLRISTVSMYAIIAAYGGQLRVRNALIDNVTDADILGVPAKAVVCWECKSLQMRHARLQSIQGIGIAAFGAGSTLAGDDLSIGGLIASKLGVDKGTAPALVLQDGTIANFAAAVFSDSHGYGIQVGYFDQAKLAALRLVGVRVAHTLVAQAGGVGLSGAGSGLLALSNSKVEAVATQFDHNSGAGVVSYRADLSLRQSLVADTAFSAGVLRVGEPGYSDGVFAREGKVSIERTVLANNLHAGVLLHNVKQASLTGTVLAGGAYGVVAQEDTALDLAGNLFLNNQTNIAQGTHMSIPAIPEVAKIDPPKVPE